MKTLILLIIIILSATFATLKVTSQTQSNILVTEWSPDGTMLLIGGTNGLLQVQQPNGEVLLEIDSLNGDINAIAWSSDSSKFAVVDASADITIWNINDTNYQTGDLIASFSGHEVQPTSLAWSPDGTRLASAGIYEQYAIRTWDVVNFQPEPLGIQRTADVFDIAWSPDSQQIAAATSTGILIFDSALNIMPFAKPDEHRLGIDGSALSIDWQPNGLQIVAAYSTQSYERPDDNPQETIMTEHHTLIVYDIASGAEVIAIEAHDDFIYDVAWSPGGTELASVSQDGVARIWQADTGELLASYSDATSALSVSWKPDGSEIAYGGEANDIVIQQNPEKSE